MRYILAIWVIVVLVGLLLISLINLTEYRASGLVLAGISSFALYRVFKLMFFEDASEDDDTGCSSGGVGSSVKSDPLEYVIFGDISGDADADDW